MILKPGGPLARALAMAVIVGLSAPPAGALAPDAGTNITGTVLFDDGVTPARGVTVRLRHRDSGQEYASRSSDATGQYEIQGVPDGEYVIAVGTDGGEFILPNRVVIVGGQPSVITLILTPAASQGAGTERAPMTRRGKAAILIPTVGAIIVAAFAADQSSEKDEDDDASPKLP